MYLLAGETGILVHKLANRAPNLPKPFFFFFHTLRELMLTRLRGSRENWAAPPYVLFTR